MEINGVAHTFITVGNFAAGRAFYGQLLPFLGLTVVADTVNTFYCVGGRTGFGIHAPAEEYVGQRFRQGSVGLHHHCFRARERADVDEAHDFLIKIGAHIVHAPRDENFAPRLLLGAVRRSGRHKAGDQSCPGQGAARARKTDRRRLRGWNAGRLNAQELAAAYSTTRRKTISTKAPRRISALVLR
jgi:catechol 2,3-dioxygenase-like lactoylglutathione lyase family enzyme